VRPREHTHEEPEQVERCSSSIALSTQWLFVRPGRPFQPPAECRPRCSPGPVALQPPGAPPFPAARDQVNQCGEEGKDDQHNHPDRLPPAAQLFVAEEIAEDLEEDHQLHGKNEGPDQEPEEVPKSMSPCLPRCRSSHSARVGGAEILHQPSSVPRQRRSPCWVNSTGLDAFRGPKKEFV
jgi:hypothetical protein